MIFPENNLKFASNRQISNSNRIYKKNEKTKIQQREQIKDYKQEKTIVSLFKDNIQQILNRFQKDQSIQSISYQNIHSFERQGSLTVSNQTIDSNLPNRDVQYNCPQKSIQMAKNKQTQIEISQNNIKLKAKRYLFYDQDDQKLMVNEKIDKKQFQENKKINSINIEQLNKDQISKTNILNNQTSIFLPKEDPVQKDQIVFQNLQQQHQFIPNSNEHIELIILKDLQQRKVCDQSQRLQGQQGKNKNDLDQQRLDEKIHMQLVEHSTLAFKPFQINDFTQLAFEINNTKRTEPLKFKKNYKLYIKDVYNDHKLQDLSLESFDIKQKQDKSSRNKNYTLRDQKYDDLATNNFQTDDSKMQKSKNSIIFRPQRLKKIFPSKNTRQKNKNNHLSCNSIYYYPIQNLECRFSDFMDKKNHHKVEQTGSFMKKYNYMLHKDTILLKKIKNNLNNLCSGKKYNMMTERKCGKQQKQIASKFDFNFSQLGCHSQPLIKINKRKIRINTQRDQLKPNYRQDKLDELQKNYKAQQVKNQVNKIYNNRNILSRFDFIKKKNTETRNLLIARQKYLRIKKAVQKY